MWAEISAAALLANWNTLQVLAAGQASLLAVVKADAYGHEAVACAPLLAAAGAEWLGVTSAEEGAAVRAVCPRSRILVMSGLFPGEAAQVIDLSLTPVAWEAWQLDLLETEARSRGLPPASIAVHLEIDTGMSRQGVQVGAVANLLPHFAVGSALRLEGVLTHFAAPDAVFSSRPNAQVAQLAIALEAIVAAGQRPRWVHAGNSTSLITEADLPALEAIATRAGAQLMLRAGLALYGYLDRVTRDNLSWFGDGSGNGPAVAPVLHWKTRVTSLRNLRAGETAGYGHTFTASAATRLALLPVGYADGLNRLLSNRGEVLLRGQRVPIAGRVSMDQTMVDVSGIPEAAIGDEVTLLGSQGAETIDAWELADLADTIPWEVLCAISCRVPRVLV